MGVINKSYVAAKIRVEVNWVELTVTRTDTGETLYKNAFIETVATIQSFLVLTVGI